VAVAEEFAPHSSCSKVFAEPKDHLDRAIGANIRVYTLVFSFSLPRDLTCVALYMSTVLSVEHATWLALL
jgi:hypothetical protein